MVAISDRTRSSLYALSAALLVGWSLQRTAFQKSIAAVAALPPTAVERALRTRAGGLDVAPSAAPVARDPFDQALREEAKLAAAAHPATTPPPAPTPAPTLPPQPGELTVPDLKADGKAAKTAPGQAPARVKVTVVGIVTGATGSIALVEVGSNGTRLVHVGDEIVGRPVTEIALEGVTLADGTFLAVGGERSAPAPVQAAAPR